MGKKLTITLTDRKPVQVDVDDWAVVAKSSSHDNQYEFQANRKWSLTVRQCQNEGDDRCIVYGVYDTQFQNESSRRGGEIIDSIDDAPAAIKRVAEYLGFDMQLADDCIADLPAETL